MTKKLPFILFLLVVPLLLLAQHGGSISGTVSNTEGERIPNVSVTVKGINNNAIADENGRFKVAHLPGGKYEVIFSAVGFHVQQVWITVKGGENTNRNIVLKAASRDINEVNVTGRTQTGQVNRQAYQVTAIDATKLHNTTLDVAHALNYVPGIRMRESGGLGSSIDFSLNGFSGNQVKFFIDGIPMDNFGSSFRINNIPINVAERIEEYKGVVPVTLGADALGGAVNIVTKSGSTNYLDASYSFGSFNTHKSSVNLGINTPKGFVFQLNAYQNYSKNNYWIESETPVDQYGTVEKVRARRFHDKYHNEMLMVSIGVRKKKWADQLLVGFDIGKYEAESQNGVTMEDVYGQRKTSGTVLMPSLKYLKRDLGIKGLNLNVSANYNLGHEQTTDTAFVQYNWLGQIVKDFTYGDPSRKGGERSRMNYRYKDRNGLASVNLSYQLNDHHSFVVNNNYTTFSRTGKDLLNESDPYYERPSAVKKNILGVAYRFDYSEKWNLTAFFKHYNQHTRSFVNVNKTDQPTHGDYAWSTNNFSANGYGLATTYFVKQDLQFRASYEHGIRVPTGSELFGNVNTLTGNFSLKPESSENVNVGIIYSPTINQVHRLIFDAGLLYRYSRDFIRPSLSRGQAYRIQQMVNLRDVDNKGVEGSIRYSFKNIFRVGANISYQHLINQTKYEGGAGDIISIVYKDRLPNMPYLFGNADAAYTFRKIFSGKNSLTFGYNLQYVHQYYEGWPSLGNKDTKITIPTQWNHNASLLYSFGSGKYNINLECLNFTDALLYDHFKLQKASRSFNVKFRYYLFNIK